MIIRNHYMAQLKSEWIKNGEGNEEVEAVADACREKRGASGTATPDW